MNKIASNYDRLTGDERFRLIIAALARGDETEAANLGRTCPSFTYNMKDREFTSRADAALFCSSILALEIAPHLRIVRFLDAQADYVNACFELVETAGYDAAIEAHWQALDPDGTADRSKLPMPDLEALAAGAAGLPHHVTDRLRELRSGARAVEVEAIAHTLAGFDAFTRNTWGMEGAEALKAHEGLFEDLAPYLDEIRETPVDDERVKSCADSFKRMWRLLVTP